MKQKNKTSQTPNIDLTDLLHLIQAKGLRITLPRRLILGFFKLEHGPHTLEDIQKKVPKYFKKHLDFTTIFRNMLTFESIDVVGRCDFGDGLSRYELRSHGHHHHLICKVCKKVESVHSCPVDVKLIDSKSFKDLTHRLEFFGVCPACQ